MKFWLPVLGAFALFIGGAAAFPHAVDWYQHGGMKKHSRQYILDHVRSPGSVEWNSLRVTHGPQSTYVTHDFTAANGLGGPVRETWTFEYDTASRQLLGVKEGKRPRITLASRPEPRSAD